MKSFYSADYRLKRCFTPLNMTEREQYLPLARLEEEALSTDISIYSTSQAQVIVDELTRGRVDKELNGTLSSRAFPVL